MEKQRWQQVETLYHAALEREQGAHEEFLVQALVWATKNCATKSRRCSATTTTRPASSKRLSWKSRPVNWPSSRCLARRYRLSPIRRISVGVNCSRHWAGAGWAKFIWRLIRGSIARSPSNCCPSNLWCSPSACGALPRKRVRRRNQSFEHHHSPGFAWPFQETVE